MACERGQTDRAGEGVGRSYGGAGGLESQFFGFEMTRCSLCKNKNRIKIEIRMVFTKKKLLNLK